MSNTLLDMIKDEAADYVDVRFTDPRGKLQHVTLCSDQVDEDFIAEGLCLTAPQLRAGNPSKPPT